MTRRENIYAFSLRLGASAREQRIFRSNSVQEKLLLLRYTRSPCALSPEPCALFLPTLRRISLELGKAVFQGREDNRQIFPDAARASREIDDQTASSDP